ncbi:MAG: transglutaminase-like domain-containing protein, partial [Desulfobacterales bacterium]|nr:transglutaminase-like domain-containing protein [Desulfobacterales bacterium]
NLDEKGTADLYEITAVSPDRALPDPKRLSGLKIEISGLENGGLEKSVLNGGRQDYRDGRLFVRKEKLPSAAGYSVPYKDEDGRMKEFLQPEWNIESDEEEIRKKAFEIVAEKTDAVAAAKSLTDWVYRHLEKRPVLSLPSALETLRTGMGDCNEHATLLTAFLRAVGIPARLSIGLAYSRERFFYHAWTEAYVGEWVSMDATLNQMPADPAHIKLIEGNLEKQVEIAGIVGQLRMKILDFQYE